MPTLLKDHVATSELTNTLVSYVKTTDINDLVSDSALTAKLNGYATTTALTTVDNKFANYALKSDIPSILNDLVTKSQLSSTTLIEVDDPSPYKFITRDDVVCIVNVSSNEIHFKTMIYSNHTVTNRLV